jgi:hypothetical protein
MPKPPQGKNKMARNDTVAGIYNYPQTIAVTTETPLLTPAAAGLYPGFPSPLFPLTTGANPDGLFISVPTDIAAGSEFDGHPFEVLFACTVKSTATTNALFNLYNAKASSFNTGVGQTGYTVGTLGTGCTKVLTGTATANLTSAVSINYIMKTQFLWDSVTKILSWIGSTQYQNGVLISNAANANATTVAQGDLNFIPSFTFASAATLTVNVTEFVINRI